MMQISKILNGHTFSSKCSIRYCRNRKACIHSQRHGYICHFSGKGQERKKSRQQKKQSVRESGRKTLRCVSFLTLLTRKWNPGVCCFLNGICFVNHLSGNKRWPCGQLEDLPSQRQEKQGEEEQVLPQAPESKDGAEGMML